MIAISHQLSAFSLWIVFAIIVSLGGTSNAQAQFAENLDGGGHLIYSSKNGIVVLSASGMTNLSSVFPQSQDDSICYSPSPRSSLVAFAHKISPSRLTVYDYLSQKTLFEVSWENLWMPCDFWWWPNNDSPDLAATHLIVKTSADNLILINVLTGEFETNNELLNMRSLLPHIKSYAPFYRAPKQNIFLYTQCDGDEYIFNNNVNYPMCDGEEEILLYDVKSQKEIIVFSDARPYVDMDSYRTEYGRGQSWSPSGRYITYETYDGINIFDTELHQYFHLQPELSLFASSPIWSHNSQYIAYYSHDYLMIYDVLNDKYVNAIKQSYSVSESNWVWSPDDRYIAFIGQYYTSNTKSLVTVDVDSVDMIIVDDDLGEYPNIIAWISEGSN